MLIKGVFESKKEKKSSPISHIRLPLPPKAQRPIGGKKGKKGYNRKKVGKRLKTHEYTEK